MTAEEQVHLLDALRVRFGTFTPRTAENLDWSRVEARLVAAPEKTASLWQMEHTGGEPALLGIDEATGQYWFVDCSPETPKGRRSLCYDAKALEERKEHKPQGSALGMAREMGIEILTEDEYRHLQTLGEFDTKTSSWLLTPEPIRAKGGAIFGDRRYDHVFTYHNGAQSYYAARGFRGSLRI